MKKTAILLLACTLAFQSYSQQNETSAQSKKDNVHEQTQAFLSVIGGISAAYVLTAQDQIEAQIIAFDRNRADSNVAYQKMMMQKNIIALLLDHITKLQTTNAIGPDSPDHTFIVDLKTTLNLMVKEIDHGIAYLSEKSASKKTQFETSSSEATKKIRTLLGME
ncbi:hypothetical protein LZZ85_15320 [Terrimonas sp. NA20]|uniref:DUF4142 domain-containing protein n=1 Tax=Terrimonas ginsenosidimutans TaxID=2908004 RepID=A0ABS9KTQ0_9BACT|nr:hypothetical protein [Terrimonas ginsenosidimutans]MCG2615670.1 hypothetical protein [Terrimonas ginsenosidimutans]